MRGLESVYHTEPSGLGLDVIKRSQERLPDSFLRGCGFADWYIPAVLVLARRLSNYISSFISHSSYDQALTERLYANIQANDVSCWYSPHDLMPGMYLGRGIDKVIRQHDTVVLLLSVATVQSHLFAHEV